MCGMAVAETHRLKALEAENAKLKKLLAGSMPTDVASQHIRSGKKIRLHCDGKFVCTRFFNRILG
jgi:hypothetical protein